MEILKDDYTNRNAGRRRRLERSTTALVAYFMGLGDDQITAEGKVQELSNEVKSDLYIFELGNTQPLIDAVNNSALAHMDAASKQVVTDILSGLV